MFIYIDESGSFAPAPAPGSWNVVAAYVAPEPTRKRVELLLRRLKVLLGRAHSEEVKLKDLSEPLFKAFVSKLGKLNGTLFASCIDLGVQEQATIARHKQEQVNKILENRSAMLYAEGRALIDDLASRVGRLSPQLYAQMVTQIDLLDQVYRSTTMYYAQHAPATLSSFRWRIDEKNASGPLFEETMRYMAPPILQTRSINDPAIFVRGFDYSHYRRAFDYPTREIPSHLRELVGSGPDAASDLRNVLRDFSFVRSHDVPGVQVADLLASAFRRVLRGQFQDSLGMARVLGGLSVQRAKAQPPIHLISLTENQYATKHVVQVARAAQAAARLMI